MAQITYEGFYSADEFSGVVGGSKVLQIELQWIKSTAILKKAMRENLDQYCYDLSDSEYRKVSGAIRRIKADDFCIQSFQSDWNEMTSSFPGEP